MLDPAERKKGNNRHWNFIWSAGHINLSGFFKYCPQFLVIYVTYSTAHQRSMKVQFGRYQKNILEVKKSLMSYLCGLKNFAH